MRLPQYFQSICKNVTAQFLFLTTASIAFAQTTTATTTTAAPVAATPSTLEMLFPFALMFGVVYFFMIRPQAKKQKEMSKFMSELKRGDEVITSGGIFGKIEGMTDTAVTLEVAQGVNIRILRSQIQLSQKAVIQQAQQAASSANSPLQKGKV